MRILIDFMATVEVEGALKLPPKETVEEALRDFLISEMDVYSLEVTNYCLVEEGKDET